MIPKLRRKFISVTAAALFAVILLVTGSINGIFIIQNTRLLSSHLDMLMENDENAPGTHFQDGGLPAETGEENSLPPQQPPQDFPGRRGPAEGFSLLPRFENRLRMRADGCVVLLDSQGGIADIRQDAAQNYSAEDLEEIVSNILDSGDKDGWYSCYRYRVTDRTDPAGVPMTLIGIINASSTLYSILTMLWVSVLIGIAGFLVVLLIIVFASGRAIRPIAESYARQKQFVTDAGHELKTPLTVISADNALARMTYGDCEWFDGIDRQVGKMNGLVRDLITLAKMDEEQAPAFAACSLSDIVYDTARSFENLIRSETKVLTLDIADGITCFGDEARLRQLVSVLMDNAVKYCDEKGKIAVHLTAGRTIRLQIINDCRNPEGFDPEKVFERFYRGDRARTPDGSYGLGLSIAKSIAELHKGSITARTADHGRILFEVNLPLYSFPSQQ